MKSGLQIRWEIRHAVGKVDWPVFVSALLLAAAAISYVAFVRPLQRESLAMQEQLTTWHLRAKAPSAEAPGISPETQLRDFYARFPSEQDIPEMLEKMIALAPAQNLRLEQGEYRLVSMAGLDLLRYEMVFPLKGNYPQIREFIAEVLKATPTMALQGISFSRENVSRAGIDAQIRLTYFVRKAAP